MSDTDDDAPGEDKPRGKKGLVIMVLVALLVGAGSFAAVWMGAVDSLLPVAEDQVDDETVAEVQETSAETDLPKATANAAFHPLDPVSVSVGTGGDSRQLRIRVVLEVAPDAVETITLVSPRLQDGILSYLRAVGPEMLEDPAALLHLRSQMLRRARLIAGDDVVANLLVTDFVLN